jgi:hypothetical protein
VPTQILRYINEKYSCKMRDYGMAKYRVAQNNIRTLIVVLAILPLLSLKCLYAGGCLEHAAYRCNLAISIASMLSNSAGAPFEKRQKESFDATKISLQWILLHPISSMRVYRHLAQ